MSGRRSKLLAVCLLLLTASGTPPKTTAAAPTRPNILIIVADDLGYSDLGVFGGEIPTPNLDRLAMSGVRLTNFQVSPTCSPTRAMLLTGSDNHRVGLGTMAEAVTSKQLGRPGYEGYLTRSAATLAERLRDAGYTTFMAGKWHLGLKPDQWPAARGFDRSFALLQGGANHFGADQGTAWERTGFRADYVADGKIARYPANAYSTDLFSDRILEFLQQPSASKPFFAYLAFTAPHWPLQAPTVDIDRHRGRYDGGPAKLRAERLARMKAMGVIAADVVAHPVIGEIEWSSLPADQRAVASRKMEIYAAMVDRLDRAVGRVTASLRASGRLDNTVVVFLSDNGAEGMSSVDPILNLLTGGVARETLRIDNSSANMGSGTSFLTYGSAWAQAGSAPFNRFKGYPTEGGTRAAAFITGPRVATNQINDGLFHVTDVVPTLLDFARVPQSGNVEGRKVIKPTGRSMVQHLRSGASTTPVNGRAVGTELFFGASIRRGDWKAVRLPPSSPMQPYGSADGRWALYDLSKDVGETQDLSQRRPDKLRQLMADWTKYARSNGVLSAVPVADGSTK